jgi:sirohydrochlorin ferrochelatase
VPGSSAIVVVAHGSRAEAANQAHIGLCAELARRTRLDVRPAFLEIADPSIPDALAAAVTDGHERVVVLPHFLAPGNHTTVDIPALVAAAASEHPDVGFELLPHTGADPRLVDLLADRLGEL